MPSKSVDVGERSKFRASFLNSSIPAFNRDFTCFHMYPLGIIEIDQISEDFHCLFARFDFISFTFLKKSSLEVIKGFFNFTFAFSIMGV